MTSALMTMATLDSRNVLTTSASPLDRDLVGLCDDTGLSKVIAAKRTGGNKRRPGGGRSRPGDEDGRTDLVTKTRPKTKKPSLYKVVLLNDDYTPMEFVVDVLERFFSMGREDATRVMLHVHHKGKGICGVFTYEIAETKVTQVTDYARQNQHPLQCTMEKE